jgi:hypothetical protein
MDWLECLLPHSTVPPQVGRVDPSVTEPLAAAVGHVGLAGWRGARVDQGGRSGCRCVTAVQVTGAGRCQTAGLFRRMVGQPSR